MLPEDRYQRDPMFRALVDSMEYQIVEARMTGTEIREAAILAAIHCEQRKPVPPYYLDPHTGQIERYMPGNRFDDGTQPAAK